jgi:hypothetical protein
MSFTDLSTKAGSDALKILSEGSIPPDSDIDIDNYSIGSGILMPESVVDLWEIRDDNSLIDDNEEVVYDSDTDDNRGN